MKQAEIDRAVARATGETVTFIKSLGFSSLQLPPPPSPRAKRRHRFRRRHQFNRAIRPCA